jgi:hypothetical protein
VTADKRIRLEGQVAVLGATSYPHAARRLRQEWPVLDLIDAEDVPDGTPCLRLTTNLAHPEGGFALFVDSTADVLVIDVAGGPFSGVIYGVEELVQRRGRRVGNGVELTIGRVEQAPGLPYRTFWTWDHSTNWDLDQIGAQEIGVFCPYGKPPDGFLADYKKMVDFMSRHRIAGVTGRLDVA